MMKPLGNRVLIKRAEAKTTKGGILLPDSAKEALRGINTDLSKNEPYVTLLNPSAHSTPLWVIPIAKSGERIPSERSK